MLNKKFEFSTNWKVSQIIQKLKSVTSGKSSNSKKKIGSYYYFGEFDNSGFSFIRRGYRPLGPNIFDSIFIKQETKTDIVVSTKPSFGNYVAYIFIICLIFLLLFESNIKFDLIKLITLMIIFLIPTLTVYVEFLSGVKKAKLFLAEFFEIDDISLLRNIK